MPSLDIRTSKRFNRSFHNECVKHAIIFLRYHKDLAVKGSEKSAALARSYLCDLEVALENRRDYKYLVNAV